MEVTISGLNGLIWQGDNKPEAIVDLENKQKSKARWDKKGNAVYFLEWACRKIVAGELEVQKYGQYAKLVYKSKPIYYHDLYSVFAKDWNDGVLFPGIMKRDELQ